MKKLINFLLGKIEGTLAKIGDLINQTPTLEENRRAYVSKPPQEHPKSWKVQPKREKIKNKEVYEHKGSAYKGKGSINHDAATFNKPRKGLFPGRNH